MNNIKYEKRIVVYIDILAFKHRVNKSKTNAAELDTIFYALNRIYSLVELNNKFGLEPITGVQVSTFSDCAVISYPASKTDSFFGILIDIIHMELDLANRGILVRGGVTIGELYHDQSIVFGPAMNEAVELEESQASIRVSS